MPRMIDRRSARRSAVLSVVILLAGCATGWKDTGVFYRGARTTLAVESLPAGARVFLNNRYLGDAPLSAALDCEQEVRRRTRQVSYWVTQPGWSLALTLASLGLYLPFSLIPVDTETAPEPTGVFKSNEFVMRVEAGGHKAWSTNVMCGPQPSLSFRAVLERL